METISKYEIGKTLSRQFHEAEPFNYVVIDNFFEDEVADAILAEFPEYDSSIWHVYSNAIENKKTCNDWNKFPSMTYAVFNRLNSKEFLSKLNYLTNETLYSDPGLHGGGWHMHSRGGKLNVHLDYDIHPKLNLQRKLNLIVYMTKDWDPAWGGGLEFWSHDENLDAPKECVVRVENKFNRAVIFDTTQNSWHGLPEPLNCPADKYRRSLATYYLRDPKDATTRKRALFAPYKDQVGDQKVIDLIKTRSDESLYSKAYITNE